MSANPFTISSTEISGFDSLAELALDMHWSWNHATDEVWRQLDSRLWEITHNPWVVLQTVSRDRIEHVLADPVFREKVDGLIEASRQAAEALAWFQRTHSQSPLTCAAYFSMEFMLSEALPIYSGGLGNVAGDQLKAASDLGVPVVGVREGPSNRLAGQSTRPTTLNLRTRVRHPPKHLDTPRPFTELQFIEKSWAPSPQADRGRLSPWP